MSFIRKKLDCGVYVNLMETNKFKKNFVSVSFIIPHNIENAAFSSLLSDVLTRGTKYHPTLKDIERELDNCYGAQLSSFNTIRAESKIISVCMDSLDDHYAYDGECVFERTCKLLSEVIFEPLVDDGKFLSEYVESEKEKLLASIARRNNSKRHYALDKCKKIMCENEPYGVASYGSIESVENIDSASLYKFYEYLLDTANVELFYVGSQPEEKVERIIEDMFSSFGEKKYRTLSYPSAISVKGVKNITEEADYKQSVLVMGYRTGITAESEEKYAFTLFNSVFGSGVNSKLFKIVREKMHLCYYASCVPELSKGVAFISSGIDSKNEEITKNAIIEQLQSVANGDFSDEDIDDCKKSLANAYRELYDSADGLCGWYLSKVIFGDNDTIEEVSYKIQKVTKEEIMNVARKMQLDTVFVLRGVQKLATIDGGECDG